MLVVNVLMHPLDSFAPALQGSAGKHRVFDSH